MINIERILCPTNLSPESDEALRYGVALARAYEARLFLFYCAAANFMADEPLTGLDPERTNKIFEVSLAPYVDLRSFANLDWEGVVVRGEENIGTAIAQAAAERKVDLIVMSARRRPRAAVLLGSTAETVCRTALSPVLVTHPREREWVGLATGAITIQRVLAAHDFSEDSALALDFALSLAQEYEAELHLVHVLEDGDQAEVAWGPNQAEGRYHEAARALQKAIPPEASLWCRVVTAVRQGRPYEELLAYAREHEIDLICMGVTGKGGGLRALFGSNVDRVLRQAPCPTLVARPQPRARSDSPRA
jgi:nucleotide-binding universal stress UspA family protein